MIFTITCGIEKQKTGHVYANLVKLFIIIKKRFRFKPVIRNQKSET